MTIKRARKHSVFQKMVSYLQEQFAALPDKRVGKNQFIPMRDIGLSAFSVFFNQCPSFLEYQRVMERRSGKNNARSLFGIEKRAKFLDQFFEKLRAKFSVILMLKFNHGTAWEGNHRDVILGSLCCCPNS